MTTSFLTCTNCGQRSPNATRCTHCGRAFGRPARETDDSSSTSSWLTVVVVIGVGTIIAGGLWQWTQRPPVPPTVTVPETTIAVPAETAAVMAPAAPPPVRKETPPVSRIDTVPAVVPDRAEPVAPAPSAGPPSIDLEHQRYATTWANVRAERNSTAAVVQVLDRGEIVAIDSLEGGWYRVTTDRPTVGYVDQQFLDTLPPP